MIATYRLSKHLPSFEFFNWLVMVQADGATRILIDTNRPKLRKFDVRDVQQRLSSIVLPGPALAGLECQIGTESGIDARAIDLVRWCRSGRTFRRLRSVKPVPMVGDYCTVTLRRNRAGAPARNSGPEWRAFAKEINAVVVEDYYDVPMDLHDRVALYAGAKMNYGVCNGPMALLTLTEYPVTMVVNTESARNSKARQDIFDDENFPWMLPGQRLAWVDDDLDSLMKLHKDTTSLPGIRREIATTIRKLKESP